VGSDALLNEHQVAQVLNLSVGTIRRWRLLGRGPRFLKVGGVLVRYRPTDVYGWLDAQPSGGNDNHVRSRPQQ
jgi:hypothetical protein